MENGGGIESSFQSRTILGKPERPKMIKWMTDVKLAKNDNQAGMMLLVVSFLSLLAAVAIFLFVVLHVGTPSTVEWKIPENFQKLIDSK